MRDNLTLVSEKRLRELIQIEKDFKVAREVVEAAKTGIKIHKVYKDEPELLALKRAIKKYDEATK